MMWYAAATMSPMVTDTEGAFFVGAYTKYNESYVTTRQYKIRCEYCAQKQSVENNACEYCGAPLPD